LCCTTTLSASTPTGLPGTKVGTFTQALYGETKKDGWFVISMKNDWKRIFPFDPKKCDFVRLRARTFLSID
jgi:hypothetical protein